MLFSILPLVFLVVGSLSVPALPEFPNVYKAEGEIRLPYAEIFEPFTAYYDGENNKSRIDYYGGMVVTIQRADIKPYGVQKKIVYTHQHERKCFQWNGTVNDTLHRIQGVVPSLTEFNFTYSGETVFNFTKCDLWEVNYLDENFPQKVNNYKLYMTKGVNPVPVCFQMMGNDVIFDGVYDKFEIVYTKLESLDKIPAEIFETHNFTCKVFSNESQMGLMSFNPMREFINNDESHVEESFEDFKVNHGKTYSHQKEHDERKNFFKHNLRYINSKNRQGNTFTLGVNHMADWSREEMKVLQGSFVSNDSYHQSFSLLEKNLTDIPEYLDWRLSGAVTRVKEQAMCASCWAFATTGMLESQYFLKTGRLVELSEQALIDCSWDFDNLGCDGGYRDQTYEWIMNGSGVPLASDYGPYLGQDGICRDDALNQMKNVQITGFVIVKSNDAQALKVALFHHGPMTISIDASHLSFIFYSSGVYYEPKCKNGITELNHGVLLVGYGIMKGEVYWLIKNSFSTYWGNDGYILMSQKNNNCGVMTAPSYVTLD